MSESNAKHLREATTDPNDALVFTYCGEKLEAKAGDSIASAMVRNAKINLSRE